MYMLKMKMQVRMMEGFDTEMKQLLDAVVVAFVDMQIVMMVDVVAMTTVLNKCWIGVHKS